MSVKKDHQFDIRLSIARYGRAGWRWTMLLTSDDDVHATAAEFRSDEDGRGTWMRMIGEVEWLMVTPPDKRSYPADAQEARDEITQFCAYAAAEIIGPRGGVVGGAPSWAADLATAQPAGTC